MRGGDGFDGLPDGAREVGRGKGDCGEGGAGAGEGCGVLLLLGLRAEERDERRTEDLGLRERSHARAGHEDVGGAHDAGEVGVLAAPSGPSAVAFTDRVHPEAAHREGALHRGGDAGVVEVRVQVDGRQAIVRPETQRRAHLDRRA